MRGDKIRRAVATVLIGAGFALAGDTSAQQRGPDIWPDSISIIVPDAYLGFDARASVDRANGQGVGPRELRAVVQQTAPWSTQHSAVVLNPKFTNVRTLYVALSELVKGNGGDAVIVAGREDVQIPREVVSELQRILLDLRHSKVEFVMEIDGQGRRVIIGSAGLRIFRGRASGPPANL